MNTPGMMFHRVAALGLCLFTAGAFCGCASGQRLGRGATSGALDELREESEQREARGERAPFERAAGHAVKGALEELDDPDRQAQFGRVVGLAGESAMQGAVGALEGAGWRGRPPGPNGAVIGLLGLQLSTGLARGFSRELRSELGANGDGPLGRSMSGWLHQASGAVRTGLIADLAPTESEGAGGRCRTPVDMRVYELSRAAGAGFTDGAAQSLRVPVTIISFGAGLLVAFAAFAIASMLHRRSRHVHERS